MMTSQREERTMHAERAEAFAAPIQQARAIGEAGGANEAALEKIKTLPVRLATRGDALFPRGDFAMPDAQARKHILALEGGDGIGSYLTISLPGKEAAPHDHGMIRRVDAAVSGQEVLRFHRRTDDAARGGYATVEEIAAVMVAPGRRTTMTVHAIHGTEVVGNEAAIGLALYGYALARFPAVVWFHPESSTMRAGASRGAEAA